MGGGIGKGTYPDHPTHIKKSVKAQDSAQWPHRERDEQEYESPSPVRWIRLVIGRASSLIVSES